MFIHPGSPITVLIALSVLNGPVGARMTDHVPGGLKVTVIKAYHLPDTDGWLDTADPYARVHAYRLDGSDATKATDEKGGTLNPVWNKELSFGHGQWTHFYIQIWDSDNGWNGGDDTMTGNYKVDILTPCSKDTEKLGNQIEYSYHIDYSY